MKMTAAEMRDMSNPELVDDVMSTNEVKVATDAEHTARSVAKLTEAWTKVVEEHVGGELGYFAKYMLEIVLADSYKMNAPQIWEQRYHLVTRQVEAVKGVPIHWVDGIGLPLPVKMKHLFCKSNRGYSYASGITLQVKCGRAVIAMNAEAGQETIHTPLGWVRAQSSMAMPVEWLMPASVEGILKGIKWHRIAKNSARDRKFDQHRTSVSACKAGNPDNAVDILSNGMLLYKLYVIANNKAKFKGFMDSRYGGGHTCLDVGYHYGKKGNGERPGVEILPRDVLSVAKTCAVVARKARTGELLSDQFEYFHMFCQKPELTLEGAYQADGNNSVYAIKHNAEWYTICNKLGLTQVNKLCARNDKLIIGGRKVAPVGKWKMFVVKHVPEAAENLFVLGNLLVDERQYARLGQARFLNLKSCVKGVGLPWNLAETGYKALLAKSSWKADGNGILITTTEEVASDTPHHDGPVTVDALYASQVTAESVFNAPMSFIGINTDKHGGNVSMQISAEEQSAACAKEYGSLSMEQALAYDMYKGAYQLFREAGVDTKDMDRLCMKHNCQPHELSKKDDVDADMVESLKKVDDDTMEMMEIALDEIKRINSEVSKVASKLNAIFAELLARLPTKTVTIPGVEGYIDDITVEGWEVEDEMFASNLYATYGMRQVAETGIKDGSDEEQEQNGFFTTCLNGLTDDPEGFDVIQARLDALASKKYRVKRPITQIKATDIMCVAKSYGEEIAKELTDEAFRQYQAVGGVARKNLQDIVINGYGKDIPVVDMDVFKRICPQVYVDNKGMPVNPSAGSFNELDRMDLGHERWSLLVDGNEAMGWPGLRNPKGMLIVQDGYKFYMPPWSVFNKDLDSDVIQDAEGNDRVVRFLGESWTQLVVLMKAAYTVVTAKSTFVKNTNWKLSHAHFTVRMNKIIMDDLMNKMDVTGRYYTILPKWWENIANSVCCTDPMWNGRKATKTKKAIPKTTQVLYMKNPALFGNPVVNMAIYSRVPKGWLNLTRQMMAALSTAIFVDTGFMLSRQDDCDGDQCVIMALGGILPTEHGDRASHDTWCANYIADEKSSLKIGINSYAPILMNDMHNGIIKSAEGKRDTGIMTQNFFNVMFYIEAMAKEPGHVETMRLMVEAYATGVQDEAVRQIKQDSTLAKFFKSAALYANSFMPLNSVNVNGITVVGRANVAADAIVERIQRKFGSVVDIQCVQDTISAMMDMQETEGMVKSGSMLRKVEVYTKLADKNYKNLLTRTVKNRIMCFFSSGFWENACKSVPQFDDLMSESAKDNLAYINKMAICNDPEELKKFEGWKASKRVLFDAALRHEWAVKFMDDKAIYKTWLAYNSFFREDSMNPDWFEGTTFGYMLSKLAGVMDDVERPTGAKTLVIKEPLSPELQAAEDLYNQACADADSHDSMREQSIGDIQADSADVADEADLLAKLVSEVTAPVAKSSKQLFGCGSLAMFSKQFACDISLLDDKLTFTNTVTGNSKAISFEDYNKLSVGVTGDRRKLLVAVKDVLGIAERKDDIDILMSSMLGN